VAINAILFLLLAEGSLRLISRWSDSSLLVSPTAKSEERMPRWRGKPGTPARGGWFNSLGFLDEEFSRERTPGVRRMVALGDSFAVGVVPYQDNFLTLLDGLLDQSIETEVYNFGIPATGPEDYLYLYRKEARLYRPDLVLLCLFVGNDIRPIRRASPLHRDSLLFFNVIRRLGVLGGDRFTATWQKQDQPTFTQDEFLEIERGRMKIVRRSLDARRRRAYAHTFQALNEILLEVGDRLRIVLIPDEFQVNEALFRSLAGGAESEFELERPQRVLREFLDERGVLYLDLLPVLREAERVERTYKPRDTHWNVRGNRVAGEAIADWLMSESWS
jgi:hypothetical protein